MRQAAFMTPVPQALSTKTNSIRRIFQRAKVDESVCLDNNQEEALLQTQSLEQLPQDKGPPHAIYKRAASQPIQTTANRMAPERSTTVSTPSTPLSPKYVRSSMFESCIQVLTIVITSFFHTVNTHQTYMDTANSTHDRSIIRKAKLLYIAMLEKVQKERGEWQGFSNNENGSEHNEFVEETATEVLNASLMEVENLEDKFVVLNELMDVSFRNLRGALISPHMYITHKSQLMHAIIPMHADDSIDIQPFPPSFSSLLIVRSFLKDVNRDESFCLLRLLSLWAAIGKLTPYDSKENLLTRVIEEKHSLVLSEVPETEFIPGRNTDRKDPVAIHLLSLLMQYRDVLFGDIEYFMVHQEMHVSTLDHLEKSLPNESKTTAIDPCTMLLAQNGPPTPSVHGPTITLTSPKKHKLRMTKQNTEIMHVNSAKFPQSPTAQNNEGARHRQKSTPTSRHPSLKRRRSVQEVPISNPLENYWRISVATVTFCAVLGITVFAFRKYQS